MAGVLDGTALKGWFEARVYMRGELIDVIAEPNLIVNATRIALLTLLSGSAPADVAVTHIGFGDSLAPAAPANNALSNEYRRAVLGVSLDVAAPQLQINWQLDELEANGLALSEFGLVSSGGVLLARKVRVAPIAKTTDVRLEGTWTLSFA